MVLANYGVDTNSTHSRSMTQHGKEIYARQVIHGFCVAWQVQQLQAELEASKNTASALAAQLNDSHEALASLPQPACSEQAATVVPRKKGSKGPGGAVGWVLRTGATVGGTILAGHAMQHYQAQQPRKE